MENKNLLVLGIGNILQKDDGLGSHIINVMQESGESFPENVEFLDGGTAGYDLVPYMMDRDKIIVVDALSVDDECGSIYHFTPEHITPDKNTYSLHDFGLKKILDMLKLSGHEPHVEIIGIVPEDVVSLDIGLTASVQGAVPGAIDLIRKIINE